jgi:RNA polymerase sigma-B factor
LRPTVRPNRELVRRLFLQYQKTKDPQVRQQLVELFNNLVIFLAKKFSNRGEPLEDIVQVGYIGLLAAIERFEPQRGLEFSTFATPTIVGEIKRYFRDKSWAVKVPRRLQETMQRADVASQRLQAKLGRQPSVNEIAKELELPPEDVLEAMEASPAQRTIPFESTGPAPKDDGGLQLTERLGREDENLDKVELQDLLDQAMRHLTPRERRIMYLRFVDELPQAEVAKRLGISQMHVSRLQRAAVEQLKREMPVSS